MFECERSSRRSSAAFVCPTASTAPCKRVDLLQRTPRRRTLTNFIRL
jgi:hypothetical protein